MCGRRSAGEIDDPKQLSGVRVVDGRGGAGPRLHGFVEVLGGKDLHRMATLQGRPNRVGPGIPLVPRGALDEVHRFGGLIAHDVVALHPQEHALVIADHDQVLRVLGDLPEAVADQRGGRRQGVDLPARGDLVGPAQRRGNASGGRIDSSDPRALPRGDDRRPHGIDVLAGQEPLPGASQLPGELKRRCGRVDR